MAEKLPNTIALALALALLLAATAAEAAPIIKVAPDSPAWTAEVLEDLHLALEALPSNARNFPGGPLEIELHPEPASLDASFFTHGLTRLHLRPFDAGDDRRALWRLGKLTPEQQQRLWRRRAIVHAIIRRWDERLRWSARFSWGRLVGWGGPRPLISYPWAFSRRAGLQSAALDLATFAEELLIPAESISQQAVADDDRVRCRELSKSRFLDERLAGLDRSWAPAQRCPLFEAWADVEHVIGFEVGFAAPSTVGAQSIFGHLFLTIVRGEDEDVANQEVLQMAALISPLEPRGFSYLARGLGGGYRGVFVLTSMSELHYEALELEQRSIRRFRLHTNPAQTQRMLERIWELERVGYVDYRFLNANCASMLRFLVAPALGDDAPNPPLTPWETPTQVLEALGPELAAPQLDEATGERAVRVGEQRRAWVKGAPPEARAALGSAWSIVQTLDLARPPDRAVAYAALATTAVDPWRGRVLLASLRIERYALDVASVARIRAERSTVLPGWKGPSTDELIAARQQRYEHEASPKRRASDALGDLLALDAVLRSAPRRPFEPTELAAVASEASARDTFDAVSAAVAALPDEVLTAALEEERLGLRASQAAAGERAVPESGYGYAFVGAALSSAVVPMVRVQAALLREELGDQRQRGFGSRNEFHLLEAAIDFGPGAAATVQRGSVVVLGARAVGGGGWGWGGRLDYGYEAGAHEVSAEIERLWAFLADEKLTNFLLASLVVRVGARVDPASSFAFSPRAGLASRLQLPGSYANALRLEAAYVPRLLVGSGVVFVHGLAARVQAVVRLGAVSGVAFSVRAEVEAQWRPDTMPAGVAALGLSLD